MEIDAKKIGRTAGDTHAMCGLFFSLSKSLKKCVRVARTRHAIHNLVDIQIFMFA